MEVNMQLSFEFKKPASPSKKQEKPQPILPADDPWESIGYERRRK